MYQKKKQRHVVIAQMPGLRPGTQYVMISSVRKTPKGTVVCQHLTCYIHSDLEDNSKALQVHEYPTKLTNRFMEFASRSL